MARKFDGLKRLGSKAGSVLVSGALACSLSPAIAFAGADLQTAGTQVATQHYEYKNNTGKQISDILNGGVQRVDNTDDDNTYQYMGYVHSDGSHYSAYSLYTEITTDSDGVVTALDITSGNDMWAGKWGNMTDAVEGYLPDGVDFRATPNSDGTWSPELSGATAKGYKVAGPTVTLMSVNATGTADALGVDQNPDGSRQVKSGKSMVAAPKYTSNSGKISDDGKITIPSSVRDVLKADGTTSTVKDASYYNLVRCAYTLSVGDDKTTFNTYFTQGDYSQAADQYIDDVVGETAWSDSAYNSTNRDGWTGITGTLALRMLGSWNAYLQDNSISTDLDGELASIDTVSGATKTSNVFVQALNQAKSDGFIKGVSEDVQVSIDKNDAAISALGESIDINAKPQDGTTVTKNADGTYTVNAHHRLYGGGRLSLLNVYVYDLSGQTVGTTGMKTLAKEAYYDTGAASGNGAYKYLKSYNSSDVTTMAADSVAKLVAYGSKQETATSVPVTTGATIRNVDGAYDYGVGDNDEYISLTYTNDGSSAGNDMPITLTTKNPSVTHVVFKYLLGHATFSMAYDLENMTKVNDVSKLLVAASSSNENSVTTARAAYDALPYDVRPFTTGIGTLLAAEAEIAAAKTVTAGETEAVSGQTYKVAKVATATTKGAVTFTKAKNAKKVTVPATVTLNDGLTYKVTKVAANSFTGSKIRSVVLGKNVTKIAAKAFAGSKATKVTVKGTSLKKAGVKNCFKNSKVKTVKVPAKKLKAYTKIFTKKNTAATKALKVTK